MPRKRAVPTLVVEPKRLIRRGCKPGRPPGEKPLITRHDGDTARAWGRWYQLQEAKIVPASMAEPTDRRCNYTFQDAKGRTVKVQPYATHMWWLSWPESRPAPYSAPAQSPAASPSRPPLTDPDRKMRWFKDRSVWTHEMHVAELEERIAKCEAEDDDPSYWQRELREYRASLR